MKKLIIMRGLPGSGKSTRARQMSEHSEGLCSIRSTDDQFMVDGQYKFDPRKLGLHHFNNQVLVESDMIREIPLIIVDNTNMKRSDYMPYVQLARTYGYSVTFEVVGDFKNSSIEKYAQRNTHGVPIEAIRRMADRFEFHEN